MKFLADNVLNSLGVFSNRENYNNFYPTDAPKPIDLWYDKNLYGKIDHKNQLIFPSEGFLKTFSSSKNEPIFALNFVVDAFEAMNKYYKSAVASNRLSLNSELLTLIPKAGFKNVNSLYSIYMELIYSNFITFIKSSEKIKEIQNFDSFIKIFLEYFNTIKIDFPLTKSEFINSKFSPIEISGLSVQLFDENHSIDEMKYSKFISDPNFSFYSKTAQNFGFLIDKNAPWRIVADINSPAMKKYLKKYFINDSIDLFNKQYYRAYFVDFETFKLYLIQFYNNFVSNNPALEQPSSSGIKEKYSLSFYSDDKSTNYWLKLYFYIRIIEMKKNVNYSSFKNLLNKCNTLSKSIALQSALQYASSELSSFPDGDGNLNFSFED